MLFAAKLIALLMSSVRIAPKDKGLKALWNLDGVSKCVLSYGALVYNNYGCYCGMGGSHQPIDGIDRCCQLHDECYEKAVSDVECGSTYEEYIKDYAWTCDKRKATCTDDSNCGSALCKCDVDVVNCWAQFAMPEYQKNCTFNGGRTLRDILLKNYY